MQSAIDAKLIRRVGISLQSRQSRIHQRRPEWPGRIVNARGAAEIEHTQMLDTGSAALADPLAKGLYIDPHFDT